MRPISSQLHPAHLITLLACALAAFGLHHRSALPEQTSVSSASPLADQIAQATGLVVVPSSPSWVGAAPAETLTDAVGQHTLVFLGKEDTDAPADIYRMDVRARSPNTIFGVQRLLNLSKSPAGDEFDIAVKGHRVAVKNRVLGQVRSVTVLDFAVGPTIEETSSPFTRFLARVTNRIEEGQPEGIGRTTARFSAAPRQVDAAFDDAGNLALAWEDAAGSPHRATITPGQESCDSDKVVVTAAVKLEKRPILWMVDTVRSFSWIGPGPIEWLEGRVFALRDMLKRAQYRLAGDDAEEAPSSGRIAAAEPFDLPDGIEVGKGIPTEIWPPPPFDPPVFKRRIPGEGSWQPAAPDFVRTLPNAPPAFYRTVTRPDLSRPYVKVEMIAMDMRQLTLHMVGGHEDPISTTGSAGTGRIPRRPEMLTRTVAAFNGAFKTMHGEYGMMVEKNVLLPPKEGAATVAALRDDTTVMGSWPDAMPIPERMISYRQNMDPLLEGDVVNPRRRYLWGFTLDEDITKMHTIRSGICISDAGYMVYAWGEDLTATTLGKAMSAAGCNYGMHLDMNPLHTAFIYYRFDAKAPGDRPSYKAELAISSMRYSLHRYVNGAPKDFFFLTLKDSSPGPGWSSEGLAQPAPAAVPSVFKKSMDGCTLLAVDLERTHAFLDPGHYPAYLKPAKEPRLPEEKSDQLLVDIDLGPWSSVRGQLANSTILATLSRGRETLGVNRKGTLLIERWPIHPMYKNAVQGRPLAEIGPEQAIALGTRGKWLFVGLGPGSALQPTMAALEAEHVIGFASQSFAPAPQHIAVRTENGMTDLLGDAVTEADATDTHLRLFAKPRPLGSRRLEPLGAALSGAEAREETQ